MIAARLRKRRLLKIEQDIITALNPDLSMFTYATNVGATISPPKAKPVKFSGRMKIKKELIFKERRIIGKESLKDDR